MKEYILAVVVPILAAIVGAIFLPLIAVLRRSKEPTYDDKQSVLGRYSCDWYVDEPAGERLYTSDVVEICTIKGSRLFANGRDARFHYKLEGNISRGGVLAFYYIIVERPMSLTGSLTLVIDPLGSTLTGRWFGFVSEGQLTGGRVIWKRSPTVAGTD